MATSRIVLVGAGHAHLYVARHARRLVALGADVLLIDPGDFWYSGLATGVLGGHYECDHDRIDPAHVIEREGGTFIRDHVDRVELSSRVLTLRGGEMVRWDIVSFNVGSVTSTDGIAGAARATPAKPISGLCALRHTLEAMHAAHGRIDAVVIGGGATGCEIALNLRSLARRRHWEATVTLVCGGLPLIEDFPAGAQTWMLTTLAERSVRIVQGRVSSIGDDVVTMASGERISMHAAILATGLRAPLLMESLGLPASREGLHVNRYLHSPVAPRVFAAGDCAQFLPRPLPNLGVFGVRQAPILLHNLAATLRGRALRTYRPQARYLTILNAGDGTALARWGHLWWQGISAMKLKEFLDLRFLDNYRR